MMSLTLRILLSDEETKQSIYTRRKC